MLKIYRKNHLLHLLVMLVVVTIVLATLAGCSSSDYYDVESTYAMAKELGYTGTLDEFVAMISGKDGVDGVGILSIDLDSSNGGVDTYKISMSNGEASYFTVKNGLDGSAVEKGDSAYEAWLTIDGNAGKSVADFIEAISGKDGENGSSITAIETATNYAIGSSASVVVEVSRGTSRGSAIIYQDDTTNNRLYLLTNYHVVYDSYTDKPSSNAKIYFYGMPYFTDGYGNYLGGIVANYVGGSYTNDVAVLCLSGDSYTAYIEYRNRCGKVDSSDPDSAYFIRPVTPSTSIVSAGDAAIAIGNPAGAGISATSGIVSVDSESLVLDLSMTKRIDTRVIRIDTAVNSGNSGGGLFSSDGSWIGIVNAKTSSTSIENIAYALPHTLASAVADNILRGYNAQLADGDATNDSNAVSVRMPSIGVWSEVSDKYATIQNGKVVIVDQVTITSIVEGNNLATALKNAGSEHAILEGDVLISAEIYGYQPVELTRIYTLKELLYSVDSPTTLTLKVLRNNVEKTLIIEITANDINAVG